MTLYWVWEEGQYNFFDESACCHGESIVSREGGFPILGLEQSLQGLVCSRLVPEGRERALEEMH